MRDIVPIAGAKIVIEVPMRTRLRDIEDEVLRQAVEFHSGNVRQTAQALGVSDVKVKNYMKRAQGQVRRPAGVSGPEDPGAVPSNEPPHEFEGSDE